MDLICLKNLAKKNPALARLLEGCIYSVLSYIVIALQTGEVLSWQHLLVAFLTPVLMALGKRNRDLKSINECNKPSKKR
jgi:hypothetical protein